MRKLDPGRDLTYAITEQLGLAVVTGRLSTHPTKGFSDRGPALQAVQTRAADVLREAVKMPHGQGASLRAPAPSWARGSNPRDTGTCSTPTCCAGCSEDRSSLGLLAEFTQMRLAIEPDGGRSRRAHNHTPETLALMQHAIARMVAAARGEDDPLASDIAFHVAVLKGERQIASMHKSRS